MGLLSVVESPAEMGLAVGDHRCSHLPDHMAAICTDVWIFSYLSHEHYPGNRRFHRDDSSDGSQFPC